MIGCAAVMIVGLTYGESITQAYVHYHPEKFYLTRYFHNEWRRPLRFFKRHLRQEKKTRGRYAFPRTDLQASRLEILETHLRLDPLNEHDGSLTPPKQPAILAKYDIIKSVLSIIRHPQLITHVSVTMHRHRSSVGGLSSAVPCVCVLSMSKSIPLPLFRD